MANIFCYCAGIIMLVPAFLLDSIIKLFYTVVLILSMLITMFFNPKKCRNISNSWEWKTIVIGYYFFFSKKVINFYFKED